MAMLDSSLQDFVCLVCVCVCVDIIHLYEGPQVSLREVSLCLLR